MRPWRFWRNRDPLFNNVLDRVRVRMVIKYAADSELIVIGILITMQIHYDKEPVVYPQQKQTDPIHSHYHHENRFPRRRTVQYQRRY